MIYALLVYLEESSFDGFSEADHKKLNADSAAYDRELETSDHLIAAAALRPTTEAITIRARADKLSTTDGPFAETKEHLGGFILVEARDLNEAIRLAAGIPVGQLGRIEVRPAFNPEG
jgi:hypothetical protein